MTVTMPELEAAIAELRPHGPWVSRQFLATLFREDVRAAIATILNAVRSGQLVPAAPEPEGKTLAELGVKPGDVVRCVAEHGALTIGKHYIVTLNPSGDIAIRYGMGTMTTGTARFTLVSRAPEAPPVDPVRLDASGAACIAAMKAIQDERLFQAALAALPGVMRLCAHDTLGPDESRADLFGRKAAEVADALLAALEAKP